MRRPPRPPSQKLFSLPLVGWSLLQGLLVLLAVGTIYCLAAMNHMPEPEIRVFTFVTLVLCIVSLIFVDRSFSSSLREALLRPNRTLAAVLLATTAILLLALWWPPASALFGFGTLHWHDAGIAFATAAGVLLVLELLKHLRRAAPG